LHSHDPGVEADTILSAELLQQRRIEVRFRQAEPRQAAQVL
jgi:hypothetical protein